MNVEANTVSEFFKAYRRRRIVSDFFNSYRKELAPHGRLPCQNFLRGSELIRQIEVNWCRVLRWLLDPQVCRPLVAEFQRWLCRLCASSTVLPAGKAYTAEREVPSDDGLDRNDIILSAPGRRIVIEAKVNALYDREQHLRYYQRWKDRADLILYIVRNEKMVSLIKLKGSARCEWLDVADLLDSLLDETTSSDLLDDRRWRIMAGDFVDLIRQEGK